MNEFSTLHSYFPIQPHAQRVEVLNRVVLSLIREFQSSDHKSRSDSQALKHAFQFYTDTAGKKSNKISGIFFSIFNNDPRYSGILTFICLDNSFYVVFICTGINIKTLLVKKVRLLERKKKDCGEK